MLAAMKTHEDAAANHSGSRSRASKSADERAGSRGRRPAGRWRRSATLTSTRSNERRDTAASTSAQATPSAAAGAGPSSAIASTNERNEPESAQARGSRTPSISLPAARTNRRPSSDSGAQSSARLDSTAPSDRRDEDRAVDDGRMNRASRRHSPRYSARAAHLSPHATCGEVSHAVRDVRARVLHVRRRLEPLRVRPFGRLLASYTVNDLGDTIGVIALSILVYDRTEAVAPTAGFFLVAKFLPALLATGLTAQLDRFALRRTLPALYVLEALVVRRAGLPGRRRPLLPAAGAGARRGRRDAGDHRARPHARRGGGAAAAARADQRGQRADEPGLRRVLGRSARRWPAG